MKEHKTARAAREHRRAKGQFWTPDWVADFMVAYALQGCPKVLFDPAVGEGAFFRAAKRYARCRNCEIRLIGRETDPETLVAARSTGLSDEDLRYVELRDFVRDPPREVFPAIVANPPYIRHHRVDSATKALMRQFARVATGLQIDGRAGLHVYFLIQALLCLEAGGRLAFIVSADICEGIFAHSLWQWITANYCLDAVITFAPDASPFPDVDTNALVFCIRRASPSKDFAWVVCHEKDAAALSGVLVTGNVEHAHGKATIVRRALAEALRTGLSRPPCAELASRFVLGDFAIVCRGVVTGDNSFFLLTRARAKELGIPEQFFVNAVGRTRDVQGSTFSDQDLDRLERVGRPTRLLKLNGARFDELPPSVQAYLKLGEERGIHRKPLLRTRRPWYRMETRAYPPFLFTYLGRRDCRFVRNLARAVPLTCLLCVYPKWKDQDFIERLWMVLSNPATVANLRLVGKSYGGGAIKVEPRALERLPLPEHVVVKAGLDRYASPKQDVLFG